MKKENQPLVSIIIPVYNAEDFIQICIESVLNQTYQSFEILCINDGSVDQSSEIIKHLMLIDKRIQLYCIENHGQGYARNLGLSYAHGEYILFLDADDYIHPMTLELSVARAERDISDFVCFDWVYYNPIGKNIKYINTDSFFSKEKLVGQDCQELLSVSTYYTVNKLYRHRYLKKHNIKFGEGYIYEDIPFWVQVVINATCVSLIPAPLYRVTINPSSSTKTNYDNDWHSKSYQKAVDRTFEIISSNTIESEDLYCLYKYLLDRFVLYYSKRTPQKYKKDFAISFAKSFRQATKITDYKRSKLYSLCIKFNLLERRNLLFFRLGIYYCGTLKERIIHYKSKLKNKIKTKLNFFLKKIEKCRKKEVVRSKYRTYLKQPLYNNVILFAGFDTRYTGNSRYLFEEFIKECPKGKKVFFITNDPNVPLEYRLTPNSDRCERFLARSKTIIFESWIPLKYEKRENTNWIQLWHGTPIKKMLFDSTEKYIVQSNPTHKNNKYKDILRWDYLISDSLNVNYLFESCFLFPKKQILPYGYPRVHYLLKNKDNTNYREKLREFYNLPKEKQIVLYLPTWRDYNYGVSENFNLDYLIDLNSLQEQLGDSYKIIYKDHSYLSKPENVNFQNLSSAETQELLLIADVLITDYSSVMFDAFAIDLPVVLYCNDIEKNEEARGVYPEIWSDLNDLICTDIRDVVQRIKKHQFTDIQKNIKEKYCCQEENGLKKLINLILKLSQ